MKRKVLDKSPPLMMVMLILTTFLMFFFLSSPDIVLAADDNHDPYDSVFIYQDGESVLNLTTEDGKIVTLYAVWAPRSDTPYVVNHWTQNLDAAISGSVEQNSSTYSLVDSESFNGTSDEEVTPAVKEYVGFETPEAQTVTIAADGSTVVDYYYQREKYSVIINKNDGVDSVIGAGEYFFEQTVTIDAIVKTGNFWDAWVGDINTTEQTYTFTMGTADIVVTATASPVSYTIVFDGNGATSGSMANMVILYGESRNLTANNFDRVGYKFTGYWNTQPDGKGTSYVNEASVKNLTNVNNAVITLYAQWEAQQVSYQVNHWQQKIGANTDQNGTNYTLVETENLTALADSTITPKVKSYTGFTSPATQTVVIKPDGSTVVNYYYIRNTYVLDVDGLLDGVLKETIQGYGTFDLYIDGVLVKNDTSEFNGEIDFGSTYEIKDIKPVGTRTYDGVYSGSLDGSPSSGTAVVVLEFSTNSLDINGYLDGETKPNIQGYGTFDVYIDGELVADDVYEFNEELPKGSTYEIKDIKPEIGHTYEGPYSGDLTGTVDGIDSVVLEFTTNTYFIRFNGNTATSGSMNNQEITYGVATNLNANQFQKRYFEFVGWNTVQNPTDENPGITYSDRALIKNLTAEDGAIIDLYAQWKPIFDLTIDVIEPNSDYREGVTVITSFNVFNDSAENMTPVHNITVDFTVTARGTVRHTETKEAVVIPGEDQNLVYFKWTVPSGLSRSNITVSADLKLDGTVIYSDELTRTVASIANHQTPDTEYTETKPVGWTSASVPVENDGTATWSEWVYEDSNFVKKTYGIKLSSETIELTPDANISSSKKISDVWTMKSGYGVELNWKPSVASIGTTPATNEMYTDAQTAYALVPEYGYTEAIDKCRLLEEISGQFTFMPNDDAKNNGRIHFTPLWYPDGTQNYLVNVHGYDCWTPAGMISVSDNTNGITIDGTLYDDYFIGRN